jgi:hypothetical protein
MTADALTVVIVLDGVGINFQLRPEVSANRTNYFVCQLIR